MGSHRDGVSYTGHCSFILTALNVFHVAFLNTAVKLIVVHTVNKWSTHDVALSLRTRVNTRAIIEKGQI